MRCTRLSLGVLGPPGCAVLTVSEHDLQPGSADAVTFSTTGRPSDDRVWLAAPQAMSKGMTIVYSHRASGTIKPTTDQAPQYTLELVSKAPTGPQHRPARRPVVKRRACWLQRACLAAAFGLAGCATTTVTLNPAPQPPVCQGQADALIVWATRFRQDQKDVAERTATAASGIQAFFQQSGCFARHEIRYVPDIDEAARAARANPGSVSFSRVVFIAVRELGPTLQVGSTAALVEGATEVVLQVSEQIPTDPVRGRDFTVHWRNGGPGVIKGVATLVADLQAALAAGLGLAPQAR